MAQGFLGSTPSEEFLDVAACRLLALERDIDIDAAAIILDNLTEA